MPNYAISDGKKIVNVIVAESEKIAEEISGMHVVETTGSPWIDWTLEEEGWRPPQPYPSWSWSGESWEAPVPYPEESGIYLWNENIKNWQLLEE